MDADELQGMLDELGYDGWEAASDAVLVCPHGASIELDGRCPHGCVSPLLEEGLI